MSIIFLTSARIVKLNNLSPESQSKSFLKTITAFFEDVASTLNFRCSFPPMMEQVTSLLAVLGLSRSENDEENWYFSLKIVLTYCEKSFLVILEILQNLWVYFNSSRFQLFSAIGAEFVVPFSSRSRSLTLKSSTFYVKTSLAERLTQLF